MKSVENEREQAEMKCTRSHLVKNNIRMMETRVHLWERTSSLNSFEWRRKSTLHYQLKLPTSPRIVTIKQHNKHTWMWPIVLSIFIHKQPIRHLIVPVWWSEFLLEHLFTSPPIKNPREQYLGSLKESLNKNQEDHGSSISISISMSCSFSPPAPVPLFSLPLSLTVSHSRLFSVSICLSIPRHYICIHQLDCIYMYKYSMYIHVYMYTLYLY